MFTAVGITKYGSMHSIGDTHPSKAECFAAFPEAFNKSLRHHITMDFACYAIVEIVEGIEMTQPPQFAVVPVINALAAPATADDEAPF